MIARRLILGFAAALALTACERPGGAPGFHSIDLTGADYGRSLALSDAEGRPRSLADYKGRVVVLFFGYTQCPDVCPGTLGELAQIRRALGPEGERLQVVFVSVDPERDSADVLREYMANFGPGFVALRGTAEQTAAAAKEFKVFYAKAPGSQPGRYSVDHTAGAYVLDAQGRLRLFTRYGSPPEGLAADLKRLLAEG